MRAKKGRVVIEIPNKQGIEAFKEGIRPYVEMIGSMMEKWADDEHKKIKISSMRKKPVGAIQFKVAKEKLKDQIRKSQDEIEKLKDQIRKSQDEIEELKDQINFLIFKKKIPEHFETITVNKIQQGFEAKTCSRVVLDKKSNQTFLDLCPVRLTYKNWSEFKKNEIPVIDRKFKRK